MNKDLEDQAKALRDERITRIKEGKLELNLALQSYHSLVLHIIPPTAFGKNTNIDLEHAAKPHTNSFFAPLDILGERDNHYIVSYNGITFLPYEYKAKPIGSYTQIFHSGMIEAIYTLDVTTDDPTLVMDDPIKNLKYHIPNYIHGLSECGIKEPLVIFVSLLNVKGVSPSLLDKQPNTHYKPMIFSDDLYFEMIFDKISDQDLNFEECRVLLKPLLNRIANITGALKFSDNPLEV